MAEELQGLLDRIHTEGIQKAENDQKKLIANAKKEAAEIINKAKLEAEAIIKRANNKALKDEERAKASIKQAARDINIALKIELLTRLNACVKDITTNAMTPEVMSDIINIMAKFYIKSTDKQDVSLELIFSPKDLEKMTDHLKVNLKENLKNDPTIFKGHDFAGGLKIGFKGNDVFFDFTDDAITDIICEYIGPRLSTIIKED